MGNPGSEAPLMDISLSEPQAQPCNLPKTQVRPLALTTHKARPARLCGLFRKPRYFLAAAWPKL